jgi:hypothetical protein
MANPFVLWNSPVFWPTELQQPVYSRIFRSFTYTTEEIADSGGFGSSSGFVGSGKSGN